MHRAAAVFALLSAAACTAERQLEPTAREILEQAQIAYGEHNYGIARDLYRQLLELGSPPTSVAYLRLELGRCLQACRSFDEARSEYQQVLEDPLDPSWGDDLKPSAQAAIAESFEAQRRWREALDAYFLSRDKYPSQHWCGNCRHDRRQRTLDAIARCIHWLDD